MTDLNRKTVTLSVSALGVQDIAFRGARSMESFRRAAVGSLDCTMERDGDVLKFTLMHPEEPGIDQADYDDYLSLIEEQDGPLADYIADRVRAIRW